MNSNNQFRFILIAIIVVVTIVIACILKPQFFGDFRNTGGIKLSSDKPWNETTFKDENIDDIDIEFEYKENEFFEKEDENKNPKDNVSMLNGEIPLRPMSDLNNKSKKEIYEERKEFVNQSIFNNILYKPSEYIFGKIDEKKHWLGIEAFSCNGSGKNAYVGYSEESRYINNPTLLIALDREFFDEKPKNQCSSVDYLMPVSINYSKKENTITVVYNVSSYQGYLGKSFLLKGLNALDLGYKFVYADVVDNIVFIEQDKNISTEILEFKDFIQVDNSCGVDGGCNNASTLQKGLNYAVINYPATLHFKLWKKHPKNKDINADINYLIILR